MQYWRICAQKEINGTNFALWNNLLNNKENEMEENLFPIKESAMKLKQE